MLRCIFGKCSSDTYVVNDPSKKPQRIDPSRMSRIEPLPPEPPKRPDLNGTKITPTPPNHVSQQNGHVKTGKDKIPDTTTSTPSHSPPEKEPNKPNHVYESPKPQQDIVKEDNPPNIKQNQSTVVKDNKTSESDTKYSVAESETIYNTQEAGKDVKTAITGKDVSKSNETPAYDESIYERITSTRANGTTGASEYESIREYSKVGEAKGGNIIDKETKGPDPSVAESGRTDHIKEAVNEEEKLVASPQQEIMKEPSNQYESIETNRTVTSSGGIDNTKVVENESNHAASTPQGPKSEPFEPFEGTKTNMGGKENERVAATSKTENKTVFTGAAEQTIKTTIVENGQNYIEDGIRENKSPATKSGDNTVGFTASAEPPVKTSIIENGQSDSRNGIRDDESVATTSKSEGKTVGFTGSAEPPIKTTVIENGQSDSRNGIRYDESVATTSKSEGKTVGFTGSAEPPVKTSIIEIDQDDIKDGKRDSDIYVEPEPVKRRSGIIPMPVEYDEVTNASLPHYPKDPDDELLIKKAVESNDFLNKILSGKRLDDVIHCMYNREISAKETIIKQGEKGSHMYVSAKGKYQVLVKGKVVGDFSDVRVFGELAILYNAKRLASIKAVTSGRVWVLDRSIYQQIMMQYNIKEQDEIMEFLMNNKKLSVVGKEALQEVANLLKSEFFSAGKQIVRQGDKGYKFYIIRAGTVTITKDGEGVMGNYKKGDCFGELALLKEDCRQATVTADAPGVECLTLTRKQFIDHFGELEDISDIKVRPQDSIKAVIAEHEDINLTDLKIIRTLGVGGFGRVELVQHTKKKDLVFALKYLKKIDIVLQHQQEHVYNEKNIQMASTSPFIVRLYRTYKDSKYIYLLMESCLGGDLWSLLQKQKMRRFEEKEARFISACVLEAFEYLHSRGIIYRDLKPENLLIAANGYIKLTDFGFAKKISSRGRTFTFAGTPEYVAPEIVLNKGHDRAVDYWAFGAFIFEMLTGRTPFRTDDSSHMKTYNKILNGIDNIQFPSYVNLKARHIVEKLCRPVPSERLGMQRGGIKDIKAHKWFLGFEWQKFAKCEIPSPFRPKLKSVIDTQYFDQFKKDSDIPPDEISGWDMQF